MDKFLNLLMGTSDIPTYCAALVWGLMGMFFVYLYKIKKRDKMSESTPYEFSIKFFITDTLANIIFSFLGLVSGLRFSIEMYGTEISMHYAFILGICLPDVIELISSTKLKARENTN